MNTSRLVLLTLLSAIALLVASCARNAKPVRFSDAWPDKVESYKTTTKSWTRRGILRASISEQKSQLVELHATFLSTEWRAAYVQRQAKTLKLNNEGRESLKEEQRKIAAEGHVVELLVATYHPSHNDLHRAGSIWRISLVDGNGREIPAAKIEKDRRPREAIAADFSHFGDFAEAYSVTFPHSPELLRGKEFALRMGSTLGSVEVNWKSN